MSSSIPGSHSSNIPDPLLPMQSEKTGKAIDTKIAQTVLGSKEQRIPPGTFAGQQERFATIEVSAADETMAKSMQQASTILWQEEIPNDSTLLQKEFPALFKAFDPAQQLLIKNKMNLALSSILSRLQVPYINTETNELSHSGFFKQIEEMLQAEDPNGSIFIAGGVVRSLLGYMYKKVFNEFQRTGDSSPEMTVRVLDRIITGASRKPLEGPTLENEEMDRVLRDKELATLSALGIGSDMDFLIEFSPNIDQKKKEQIINKLTHFINSAETRFLLSDVKDATLKKSLVPIGDVKEYSKQIERAVGQGGSTLDFLAFPLSHNVEQEIRMPEHHAYIMDNFINGKVEYLKGNTDNPDKQTVRALRFIEIPFLQFTEKSKEILINDLNKLIAKIKSGETIDPLALEQFQKLIRNARFGGAYNRFAVPNEEDPIAKLVHIISTTHPRGDKEMPLIPEFNRNVAINRNRRDIEDVKVKDALVNLEEFNNNFTCNGVVYHGTPKLEYVLTMIRNGLMPSIPEKQGKALAGAGFYTTKDRDEAQGYSGSDGAVLELPILMHPELRILNMDKFRTDNPEKFRQLESEAHTYKLDINQYLAQKFDLDIIIVGRYPLIMNSAAIVLPKKMSHLIKMKLQSKNRSIEEAIKNKASMIAFKEYYIYYPLGKAIGLHNIIPPLDLASEQPRLLEILNDPTTDKAIVLDIFILQPPTTVELQKQMVTYLLDSNSTISDKAAALLSNLEFLHPDVIEEITKLLQHNNPKVRMYAIHSLSNSAKTSVAIQNDIAQLLNDNDFCIVHAACRVFLDIQSFGSVIAEKLISLIDHHNTTIASIAIESLQWVVNKNIEIQKQMITKLLDGNISSHLMKAQMIGNLITFHQDLVLELLQHINSLDINIQTAVIRGLTSSIKTEYALQQIIKLILKADLNLGLAIAAMINNINPLSNEIMNQIIDYLNHENSTVRATAIYCLRNSATSNVELQQKIATCLVDSDPRVRISAQSVLQNISFLDSSVLDQMTEYWMHENSEARTSVSKILTSQTYLSLPIQEKIASYLLDVNSEIAETAIKCLEEIKDLDPKIIDKIAKYLDHEDSKVRVAALNFYNWTYRKNSIAPSQIIKCLCDSDKTVFDKIQLYLYNIKPSDDLVNKLLSLLESRHEKRLQIFVVRYLLAFNSLDIKQRTNDWIKNHRDSLPPAVKTIIECMEVEND